MVLFNQLFANGQAIKLVNVAERMEAGEQDFSSGVSSCRGHNK